MELKEMQQLRQLPPQVNGKLKRRTWIAVVVVTGSFLSLALWNSGQIKRRADNYETSRRTADSLAYEQGKLTLEAIIEVQNTLKAHDGKGRVNTVQSEKLDSAYLETINELKNKK